MDDSVSLVDREMNIMYVRLIAQGKTFLESLSILDSVYALIERIQKNEEFDVYVGSSATGLVRLRRLQDTQPEVPWLRICD